MASKFVIHPTQFEMYQRCPRKFKFAVVDRLVPKQPVTALAVGSLGHKALEAFYREGKNPADAFAEHYKEWLEQQDPSMLREDVPQQAESLHAVLQAYPEWAADRDRWAVWYVEQRWELPIHCGDLEILLRGRFDLVVHGDGRLWVVDHKFVNKLPNRRVVQVKPQFTHYSIAAKALWPDEQLGGVYPNYIRKTPPKTKSTVWFDRFPVWKTDAELSCGLRDLERTVKTRLLVDLQEDQWTPHYDYHCASCEFYNLCRAMDTGMDMDTIIETSFTRAEKGEEGTDFGWMEDEEEAA